MPGPLFDTVIPTLASLMLEGRSARSRGKPEKPPTNATLGKIEVFYNYRTIDDIIYYGITNSTSNKAVSLEPTVI